MKRKYLFECGRWLSNSEDDGQIVRELPAKGKGIDPLPGKNSCYVIFGELYFDIQCESSLRVCLHTRDSGQCVLLTLAGTKSLVPTGTIAGRRVELIDPHLTLEQQVQLK